MNRTLRGAIIGTAGGLGAGILGELLVLLVRWMFPTDVAIVGFALIWAVPFGLLIGAVCGWRGWSPDRGRLAIAAAIPGLLAGAVAVAVQMSAV